MTLSHPYNCEAGTEDPAVERGEANWECKIWKEDCKRFGRPGLGSSEQMPVPVLNAGFRLSTNAGLGLLCYPAG